MPIVPSRSKEIQGLVAALAAPAAAERDSAAARLALLGSRAVLPLAEALRAGTDLARREAVLILGRSDDTRARKAVLAAVADPAASVAGAAVGVVSRAPDAAGARALAAGLRHPHAGVRRAAAEGLAVAFADGVPEATQPVVDLLLDEAAGEELRLLAADALARLPGHERDPLLARLQGATGALGRRVAALRAPEPEAQRVTQLAAGLDRLPRGAAAVTLLHDRLRSLVDGSGPDTPGAWELRLRLHRELALRKSGIALYDLRELLERRPPRDAASLLEIVTGLADASFVPTLAALAHDAPRTTAACIAVLSALIRREGLKKSHRAVRAVPTRHRAVLDGLWSRALKRR